MDTDILLRQSVSHLRNVAAREDDHYVNGAFLSFDRYSPAMLYCLHQIPLVYDAFIWNSVGPALMTSASKIQQNDSTRIDGNEWKFNVLDRKSFYDVNWENMNELTSDKLTRSEYDRRKDINLGYHFWGKVFFGDKKRDIAESSILGYALQSTCHPGIMDCIQLS